MPFVKAYNVSDGVMAGEHLPDEPEQLYATPAELGALFGVRVTESQIRHAMSLIHAHCHRQTLWPAEYLHPLTRLPADRMETRLPVTPVIRVEEAAGRYAYGMRRDRQSVNALYYGLGAIIALQGVAPRLVPIQPDLIQVEAATGIVSLPYGTFLLPYSEVTFRYLAGYLVIPGGVKTALAGIINNVTAKGVGDRIAYNVGRIARRYATPSFITADEERLLAPFVVTGLF
jgi:hypothetical protein